MKGKVMKDMNEALGMVIETELYGKVKIIDVQVDKNWGTKVNIYLDRYHSDSVIGSFYNDGGVTGGAVLVTKTDEPADYSFV